MLLDAGDAVAAGNLTYRMIGEPVLRLMAEAGYDAMAMGNRESHPLRYGLEGKLRDALFPVLAANMREAKSRGVEIVRPYVILTTPSAHVAVIGLAPLMTKPGSIWARVVDYVFDDPVETVRELGPRLHAEADVVVCLSHCGERVDRALAAMSEVDLVLGGHTHREFIGREPGQALVVHPGHHASHVAKTEISARDDARSELIALERGR